MPRMVRIVHRDGREAAIEPKDFTRKNVHPDGKTYAEQGFRIDRYEDGAEYDGPKSQREIDKSAEERQAARTEKPKAEAKKAD